MAKQALDIAAKLGIDNSENCTVMEGAEKYSYFGFDGPVTSCKDWEMSSGVPVHKNGQMKKNMQKTING